MDTTTNETAYTKAKTKSYSEWTKIAQAFEADAQWSKAAEAWDHARRAAKHPPSRMAAISKRDSAKRNAAEFESPEETAPAVEVAPEPKPGVIAAAFMHSEPGDVLEVSTVNGKITSVASPVMGVLPDRDAIGPAVVETMSAEERIDAAEEKAATALREEALAEMEVGRFDLTDEDPRECVARPAVSLDEQLIGNPVAESNAASWEQAQPTAEEMASSDDDVESDDEDETDETPRGVQSIDIDAMLDKPKKTRKTTVKEKPMHATPATKTPKNEATLAKKERVRMKQNKFEVGMEFQHTRRGKILATCFYAGEREFVFDKKVYTSLSSAASAAAAKIGLTNTSINGWIFWGVEKREA